MKLKKICPERTHTHIVYTLYIFEVVPRVVPRMLSPALLTQKKVESHIACLMNNIIEA